MQTLHIPTYIHTYWQCFLLCSPYIFLASFVLSFLVAFEVPRICNWLQLIAKCIGLKIEDWRFSEKLLQSRSGLKIEDSQKNFFNPILDSQNTLSTYNTWIQISRLQKIYHPHWAKWLLEHSFPLGAAYATTLRNTKPFITAIHFMQCP